MDEAYYMLLDAGKALAGTLDRRADDAAVRPGRREWNLRNPRVSPFRALLEAALDSLPAAEQQRFLCKRTLRVA